MFGFPGGQIAAFCVTFAVGVAGYFLFRFLRFPSPAILGSMVATGILNAAGFYPSFNISLVSFFCNILVGVMIGQKIDRSVIAHMARMVKPVLIQTAGIFVLSLTCGLSMYLTGSADLKTSLISGTAGGIAEMIIFGMSIDADISVVAFVQVFRVVVFLALIPYQAIIAEKIAGILRMSRAQPSREKKAFLKFFMKRDYLMMIPMAFAGGALALWLEIPTGALLGSMLACGGIALLIGKQYKFDNKLSFIAQIGIGLVTGAKITPQIFEKLGTLLVPAIVVTLVMLVGCFLMALLLYKMSEWNLATCLLCVSPAGLSQIVTLAESVGADPLVASVFHTVRIVGIVTFYPWLVLPFI